MINIVVVGLTQTKLANLANTKVKREVLVAFINFSPLPVLRRARPIPTALVTVGNSGNPLHFSIHSKLYCSV